MSVEEVANNLGKQKKKDLMRKYRRMTGISVQIHNVCEFFDELTVVDYPKFYILADIYEE